MQKIKAFSLAETLLTLMIIGIVATLMIRVIHRVNPNTEKILFIKSYRALETAVSNIINDPTKYDSTYLTDSERITASAQGTILHQDFRDAPYSSAEISFINKDGYLITGKEVLQNEAVCYFVADQFNNISGVECPNNSGYSFKTSNGVCYSISATNSDGETTVYISPDCVAFSSTEGKHKVTIFRDGKMTVEPNSTAYEWLQRQAELN